MDGFGKGWTVTSQDYLQIPLRKLYSRIIWQFCFRTQSGSDGCSAVTCKACLLSDLLQP